MQYRFKHIEHNGLKGIIGEQLARSFVRNKLAPSLVKEEGWDQIVLSRNNYKQHARSWNKKLFKYDHFRDDFIVHGFYASRKLLIKYATAVGILEQNHCTPDGILLKLKETGKMKKIRKNAYPSVARLRIDSQKRGNVYELQMVEGDLEIIEIKCGRNARLIDKQKETYNSLIAKGVPLRLIRVRIVSFDQNKFLVEESKHENLL
ncbi:MAG: hypothetical protein PVH12_07465 [Candidatus Bathyarchaeota archaeon]